MKIVLDLDNWTLADVEALEEAAGMPLGSIGQAISAGKVTGRMTSAIVYAAKRRQDPSYTLQQAKALKLSEFELSVEPEGPLAPASAS